MRGLEIAALIGGLGIEKQALDRLWSTISVDVSAATLCSIADERKALTTIVLTGHAQDSSLWRKALKTWRSDIYVFPESEHQTPLLEGRRGNPPKAWICTGQSCRLPLTPEDDWPQFEREP